MEGLMSLLMICSVWLGWGYFLVRVLKEMDIKNWMYQFGWSRDVAVRHADGQYDENTTILFSILWPLSLLFIIIIVSKSMV